jgi:hypothetical protein
LGNIVQQIVDPSGNAMNSIVGNYQANMTYTGKMQQLSGGMTQKSYRYGPLNSMVDIIFNSAGKFTLKCTHRRLISLGQLVSAKVVKDRSKDQGGKQGDGKDGGNGGGGGQAQSQSQSSNQSPSQKPSQQRWQGPQESTVPMQQQQMDKPPIPIQGST